MGKELDRTKPWPQNLEWHVTWHWLEKYLPEKGRILDAGGGPGRYAIELAKRGYDVVLLDINMKHLQKARKRIQAKEIEEKVEITHGSVRNLKDFERGAFDAVLCLGCVLTYLMDESKRKKAVRELKRVCKEESPIFLGLCGLVPVLSTVMGFFPQKIKHLPKFFATHFLKSKYTRDVEGIFVSGHYFTPKEAEDLVVNQGLQVEKVVGLQGPASPVLPLLEDIEEKEKRDTIQEVCVKTSDLPGMATMSTHFLVICSKK